MVSSRSLQAQTGTLIHLRSELPPPYWPTVQLSTVLLHGDPSSTSTWLPLSWTLSYVPSLLAVPNQCRQSFSWCWQTSPQLTFDAPWLYSNCHGSVSSKTCLSSTNISSLQPQSAVLKAGTNSPIHSNTTSSACDHTPITPAQCKTATFLYVKREWQSRWSVSDTVLHEYIDSPGESHPPGFNLPSSPWVHLNHLRTENGCPRHDIYKMGYVDEPGCVCGTYDRTMLHILEDCTLHSTPFGSAGLMMPEPLTIDWLCDFPLRIWLCCLQNSLCSIPCSILNIHFIIIFTVYEREKKIITIHIKLANTTLATVWTMLNIWHEGNTWSTSYVLSCCSGWWQTETEAEHCCFLEYYVLDILAFSESVKQSLWEPSTLSTKHSVNYSLC